MILERMKNNTSATLRQVTLYGENLAKTFAPHKTGGIVMGIHSKIFKTKSEIISIVPKSFPYHFWVNQEEGFEVLNFRKSSHQPFFRIPQMVKYGVGGVSPAGNEIDWWAGGSGKGYFTKTFLMLQEMYGDRFDIAIENSLKR